MKAMHVWWGLVIRDKAPPYPNLQFPHDNLQFHDKTAVVVNTTTRRRDPIGVRRVPPVVRRPLPRNWTVVGVPSRRRGCV